MWLMLALAIFLAGWMIVRFAAGLGLDGERRDRHPDDVRGQVYDFERMKEALEKKYPTARPRWYVYDDDTDDNDNNDENRGTR